MKNKLLLIHMTKIAILSALAGVLNLFTFPLPFFPPFYELDLSDTVVLVGAFSMGPWAGVIIEAIKQGINLCVNGTVTAFVGELANFLMGVAFVFPAALLYQKKKSFSRALIGIGVGLASLVTVSALLNYFVLIPAYAKAFGMETVMKMATSAVPAISDLRTLVLFATVPFNFMKGLVCSVITVLLYKRVSPLLKKI
ncbi:MAG: ECF transporter S component [Clostridia bacterium]|nr:ECF transporter S component [Clostridia bacterium]